jgi:CRISPR/Cas system CMR-associated protein Cmr5 small subunit
MIIDTIKILEITIEKTIMQEIMEVLIIDYKKVTEEILVMTEILDIILKDIKMILI